MKHTLQIKCPYCDHANSRTIDTTPGAEKPQVINCKACECYFCVFFTVTITTSVHAIADLEQTAKRRRGTPAPTPPDFTAPAPAPEAPPSPLYRYLESGDITRAWLHDERKEDGLWMPLGGEDAKPLGILDTGNYRRPCTPLMWEAFTAGKAAAWADPAPPCPHETGTPEAIEWQAGYDNAKANDLPL